MLKSADFASIAVIWLWLKLTHASLLQHKQPTGQANTHTHHFVYFIRHMAYFYCGGI